MASQNYKFEGWLGHDEGSADGKMAWGEFEPKPWEETDVDIRITHCGICGSDIHTLRSGWVRLFFLHLQATCNLLTAP
jgi:D-arabinose 1-dehydrogenase-like Zn-dependent alcohol dehydrogenase